MLKIALDAVVAGLLAACAGGYRDNFSEVAVVQGQPMQYPVGYYPDRANARIYSRQLQPGSETVIERESTVTR